MSSQFTFQGRARSIRLALRGVWLMARTQHNAWIHALATVLVIAAGLFFEVSRSDWLWLVLAMMAVWIAEALNTALERLADVASPEFHPLVEQAKDVAAGAVLIAAVGSIVIGALVFGPHVAKVLERAW